MEISKNIYECIFLFSIILILTIYINRNYFFGMTPHASREDFGMIISSSSYSSSSDESSDDDADELSDDGSNETDSSGSTSSDDKSDAN